MPTERIDRHVQTAARWMARLAGVLILVIALLVTGDVLARNLTGRTVLHSFEISAYLFAAALSLGLAHTLATGGNIRIDVIYALFPPALRRALDLLALAGVTALGLFLAWFGWGLALNSLARGVASNTVLAVPMAIPQMIWAAGITAFGLVGLALTLRHAVLLATGRLQAADRLAGIVPDGAEVETGEGVAR
ncbi:MAG: TRAP transporter small permease [Pararhodobacter sp.]|nr:TRAP transporter small permease [Pararhodobacter sp.]